MKQRTIPVSAFVGAASLAALGAALTAQYGFGLRPCVLCLAERVPFAVAAALGVAGVLVSMGESARRRLVALAGIFLLINAGIAVYHVGVEQHLWASPGCSADMNSGPVTTRNLAAAMSRPAEIPCDKPAWQWHGITMAALNIFYSAGLGAVTLAMVRRRKDAT